MDKFSEMKDNCTCMDIAPIFVPEIIDAARLHPTLSTGIKNLVEQFWFIIETNVRRSKFRDIETITTRIIEASEAITMVHIETLFSIQ